LTPQLIRSAAASYWRYTRQCPLVAFEAPDLTTNGLADVLVVDSRRQLLEIEVKVSMADLYKDRHKNKHWRFARDTGDHFTSYFYFAVPHNMANRVSLICDQLYPYAGVLGYSELHRPDPADRISIHRESRRLRAKRLTWQQIYKTVRAQSATVCRQAQRLAENGNKLVHDEEDLLYAWC